MSRRSLSASVARVIGRVLAPKSHKRGFDAASGRRFAREANMGRMATEAQIAAPRARSRGRYYFANDGHASAGAHALVTYAVGTGPLPAHEDSELVETFVNEWWNVCDADGRLDFGGLIALATLEMTVAGECFVLLLQRPEGLRLRLVPAEQVAEDMTRPLAGGGWIDAGIEFSADGDRVAYWIRPAMPISQYES